MISVKLIVSVNACSAGMLLLCERIILYIRIAKSVPAAVIIQKRNASMRIRGKVLILEDLRRKERNPNEDNGDF